MLKKTKYAMIKGKKSKPIYDQKESEKINLPTFLCLLIPFAGTTLGSACVFLTRSTLSERVQRLFTGFASGVMVAASVWSLLIPAMNQAANMEKWAFIPAVIGFCLGIAFLLVMDEITPHLHNNSKEAEGPKSKLKNTTKLMLAVTLHNVPEGMAVGVVFAGLIAGKTSLSFAAALALSLGIAIQNFPEGAILSMPLYASGEKKGQAFLSGMLSGVVEPLAAFLTILFSNIILPILPYLLSFAAGAMLYVVVEELIPEMSQGKHSNIGTIAFALGFSLMMVLDVALG